MNVTPASPDGLLALAITVINHTTHELVSLTGVKG